VSRRYYEINTKVMTYMLLAFSVRVSITNCLSSSRHRRTFGSDRTVIDIVDNVLILASLLMKHVGDLT